MDTETLVKSIHQQFIDYFGEDKVDLQQYDSTRFKCDSWEASNQHLNSTDSVILVHWPTVKVTNEFDESVEIWDLYAASIISSEGRLKIGPIFNRSTYDNVQWISDYAHKV